MTKRVIEPFVLVVSDSDASEFTVEGPMVNDNPWNAAVCAAQDQGRQVNCYVPGNRARHDRELAAQQHAEQFGFKRVPRGSIVRP